MTLFLLTLMVATGCAGTASLSRPMPPPNVERGVALYREGNFEEAERVLEQATVDEPGNPRAWTYLGLARVELRRPADAVPPLEKAAELDPDFAEARYGLGLAHGYLKELDAAIEELGKAVELNPTHAYAHYQLGLAFNEKGKIDRTLLHLNRFLELAPNAPEAPRVRELLARLR